MLKTRPWKREALVPPGGGVVLRWNIVFAFFFGLNMFSLQKRVLVNGFLMGQVLIENENREGIYSLNEKADRRIGREGETENKRLFRANLFFSIRFFIDCFFSSVYGRLSSNERRMQN